MDYGRLIADHDRIDSLCARLAKTVDAANADIETALSIRNDLASELRQHLSHEDSFIYPRTIDGRDDKFSALARRFVTEFAKLVEDWGAYLSEWSPDCVEADWTTFCSETRALLKRMRHRVERENKVIYPAALQCGAVTLQPGAA